MAFTDYLAQLAQPRQAMPDPGMNQLNILQQALQRKQAFDLQEAERQRLAVERERTQAKEQFGLLQKLAENAQGAGDIDMAGKLYNQAVAPANKLGLDYKPLVGGMRALSNDQAAAMPNKDVSELFSYDAQGNFRPAVQDFNNQQTQARISGFTGYKPTLKGYDIYDDVLDERGNLIRKGKPKPVTPMYSFVPGTGVAVDMRNPNNRIDTGVTPQMTPDQIADNRRADDALAFRKQVQGEADQLRRAAAKIRDEKGMASLRLRVKSWARKTATNDLTGIVDSDQAALNEEQLMQELDLINQTEKDKRAAASVGDTTKNQQANEKAKKALTNIYGGGGNYLALSQAFPQEHEAMLMYFVNRAKGQKGAAPYSGEQIKTMIEQATSKNPPRPQAQPSSGVRVAEDVLKGLKF